MSTGEATDEPATLGATDTVELTRLSTEWAWLIDHQRADQAHQLFSDAATLHLTGQSLAGRAAIAAWGAARVKSPRVSRHFITNHRFSPIGSDEAEGTADVMSVSDGQTPSPQQAGGAGIAVFVGEYHDRYVRVAGRWLIGERRFELLFEGRLDASNPATTCLPS